MGTYGRTFNVVTKLMGRHDIQHDDTRPNDTSYNRTQPSDTHHHNTQLGIK
jgi:hypothetical protein